MKNVNGCIICGSPDLTGYTTVCSPFLAERIWNTGHVRVQLVHCNACGITFYNPRLNDNELERLYKDYRSPGYQRQRERHEPWYTREANNTETEIDERTSNISDIFARRCDAGQVRTVLDYGGDRGQFIPGEFAHADRYVYDISNVPLLPGIKRVSDITTKFDIIMCCHVLEHVSDPHEVIDRIMQFSHSGTKFYFELPADLPLLLTPRFINVFFAVVNSRAAKLYFRIVNRPDGVVFCRMHEHINYFSGKSLEMLLESHGMNVEYIAVRDVRMSACSKQICCYATVEGKS